MPDWIVVIGADCSGNSFGMTSRVARSFTAWIKRYSGRWAKGLTYADF